MQISSDQHKLLLDLRQHQSAPLYLVGGIVRDLLLEHLFRDRDLDLVVEADAIPYAQEVHRRVGGELKTFPAFHTAKILAPPQFSSLAEIDFASARIEHYERPGALPRVELAALGDDLKRRDFTINALAISLEDLLAWIDDKSRSVGSLRAKVIDHFDGLKDLENRTVRIIHPKSFREDPTRMFRGCRYCARLEGRFDRETEAHLTSAVHSEALTVVSRVRILNELRKVFSEQSFLAAWDLLVGYGLVRAGGWHAPHSDELVRAQFARLSHLQQQDGKVQAETALALLVHSWEPERRGELIRGWQLSKRQVKQVLEDLDAAHRDDEAISPCAAMVRAVLRAPS